jgi:hypothetical protein
LLFVGLCVVELLGVGLCVVESLVDGLCVVESLIDGCVLLSHWLMGCVLITTIWTNKIRPIQNTIKKKLNNKNLKNHPKTITKPRFERQNLESQPNSLCFSGDSVML